MDVKKFLFLGPQKRRDQFFQEAQKLGLVDFIQKRGKSSSNVSQEVLEIIQAIRVLRTLNPVVQYDSVPPEKAKSIVVTINQTFHEHEELLKEHEALQEKIHIVTPFGPFSMEKIKRLEKEGRFIIQFFALKKGGSQEVPPEFNIFKVGESEDLDYLVSISKKRYYSPNWIEMDLKESVDGLKLHYEENQKKLRQLEQTLKSCSQYNNAIHLLLLDQMNNDHLLQAFEKAEGHLEDNLFMVAGWVPKNKVESVKKFCHNFGVICKEIEVEKDDFIPTCLQNEGAHKIGEDLVHIYDTPSHTDVDPSLWVLVFFSLFFAIIVGDAGYGLIYLIISLFLWWKYPEVQGFKRRVLILGTVLSSTCIAWGILVGAYFGLNLSLDNPLKKYSMITWLIEKKTAYHISLQDDVWQNWIKQYPALKNISDPSQFLRMAVKEHGGTESYEVINRFQDNIFLEIALFVGVVHIILSMARYALRHYALIGWILFMVGAYLWISADFNYTSIVNFVFGISKETAKRLGEELAIAGLVISVVAALIQERMYGILEITKLIQILADTLSYLRLYALGMAGGILAATINDFAVALPAVIGFLVAFLAHTFNMALGIMSGVIHGLRLNFLEWYHYSFYGGGKEFKPLRILTKDE